MIDVKCPSCGKGYRVGDDKGGKKFRCKDCDEIVAIPTPSKGEFDDFGTDDDDYGAPHDGGDSFDDAFSPKPRRGASRPQTRRKGPRKKSGSGGNVAVIIGAVAGGAIVLVLVVAGIAFGLKGLGSGYAKHEKLADELVVHMEELASAMESVKDQQSARTAATRVNAVCDKLDDWMKRAKDLPKITKRQDDKLKARIEPKLNAISARIQGVVLKVRVVSNGEPSFIASMKRLQQTGQKMQQMGRGF